MIIRGDQAQCGFALCSGFPLRFVDAIFSSSLSFIDSIDFDAPLSSFLGVSPRLADKAAPAAFCWAADLAGMTDLQFALKPSQRRKVGEVRKVAPEVEDNDPASADLGQDVDVRLTGRSRLRAAAINSIVTGAEAKVCVTSSGWALCAVDDQAPCRWNRTKLSAFAVVLAFGPGRQLQAQCNLGPISPSDPCPFNTE
jgi:hypothetical protein